MSHVLERTLSETQVNRHAHPKILLVIYTLDIHQFVHPFHTCGLADCHPHILSHWSEIAGHAFVKNYHQLAILLFVLFVNNYPKGFQRELILGLHLNLHIFHAVVLVNPPAHHPLSGHHNSPYGK